MAAVQVQIPGSGAPKRSFIVPVSFTLYTLFYYFITINRQRHQIQKQTHIMVKRITQKSQLAS
jgi:hypothetical protein